MGPTPGFDEFSSDPLGKSPTPARSPNAGPVGALFLERGRRVTLITWLGGGRKPDAEFPRIVKNVVLANDSPSSRWARSPLSLSPWVSRCCDATPARRASDGIRPAFPAGHSPCPSLARFGVALLGSGPAGAATNQRRATPWVRGRLPKRLSPVRARHPFDCAALSGLDFIRFTLFPRALPWAGMWLPLPGGKWCNTKTGASG